MFLLFPSCSYFSSCSFPLKFFLPRLLSFSLLLFLLSLCVLTSASSLPSLSPTSPFSSFNLFFFVPHPYPPILLSPPSPALLFPSFTSPLFPLPFPLPSLSFLFTSPPTIRHLASSGEVNYSTRKLILGAHFSLFTNNAL